jgi:cyclic AMP-dependent transcription factor ATF-2
VTEEDHKRNKFLERNRIAASKCREKKKQYVTELEDRKSALEFHNHQLRVEFDALVGEISELKHQLMAHAKCNDPHIDLWLQKEAAKFVQTTDAGAYAQSSMAFAHGLPSELPTANSDHSRNHSIASSYASLQGMQFEGLNAGERQGSIAYSHGELICFVFFRR